MPTRRKEHLILPCMPTFHAAFSISFHGCFFVPSSFLSYHGRVYSLLGLCPMTSRAANAPSLAYRTFVIAIVAVDASASHLLVHFVSCRQFSSPSIILSTVL
jgi:hypothetical protein